MGRRLIVWGAGRAGSLAIALLRGAGREPALVVDRNPQLQGNELDGVPVRAPEAMERGRDFVLLASMHAREMSLELVERGWRESHDFATFPTASIYRPEFGFVLDDFVRSLRGRAFGPARGAAGELPDGDTPSSRPAAIVMPVVTLFASSAGNFYFRELRDFLAEGLRSRGWSVHAADENAVASVGVPLVVGPHEFFSVGRGAEWFSEANLRAAVLVTTEQPQSLWFQAFAPALRAAGGVLDLSPRSTDILRASGVVADWLPLGWYDGCGVFDGLPSMENTAFASAAGRLRAAAEDTWDDRPIDILFVGSGSPRRRAALEALRAAVPGARWHVQMPSDERPVSGQGVGQVDSATCVALARRAKILLNLHRDDTRYFEWQRIVWRGLWQRTLVVTEPVDEVPGLVEGRDYVAADVEHMAATLRDLLASPTGSTQGDAVRLRGHEQAMRITFEQTEATLLAAVSRVARAARVAS